MAIRWRHKLSGKTQRTRDSKRHERLSLRRTDAFLGSPSPTSMCWSAMSPSRPQVGPISLLPLAAKILPRMSQPRSMGHDAVPLAMAFTILADPACLLRISDPTPRLRHKRRLTSARRPRCLACCMHDHSMHSTRRRSNVNAHTHRSRQCAGRLRGWALTTRRLFA